MCGIVGMFKSRGTVDLKDKIVLKIPKGNKISEPEKMEGGEIIIEGNAGFWVGDDMKGGTIWIRGNVRSISGDRWGGKIYVWRNGWIAIERG